MGGDQADFFVSHAGADRAWAEWVAWQLVTAGYRVELDVWDWAAGQNFVTAISDALERCDRVVALFSAAYFDRSRYTTQEWSAAVLNVPGMVEGRLVPVRIEDVPAAQMPAVLQPLLHRDLFGRGADQARHPPRRPARPSHLARLGTTAAPHPGHHPCHHHQPNRSRPHRRRNPLSAPAR